MKILRNRDGIAYIYVCIIVLFVSTLLSVIVLYMGLMSQVQIQKREIQQKLDSYLAEYATKAFDAIKQGEPYESHINYAEFKSGVYPKMGFPTSDATVYRYDNGNCTMTRPTVTVLRGDGFGLTLRYTAIFPIRWNGKTYQSLKVPITVSSYYKFK